MMDMTSLPVRQADHKWEVPRTLLLFTYFIGSNLLVMFVTERQDVRRGVTQYSYPHKIRREGVDG